LVAKLTPF